MSHPVVPLSNSGDGEGDLKSVFDEIRDFYAVERVPARFTVIGGDGAWAVPTTQRDSPPIAASLVDR